MKTTSNFKTLSARHLLVAAVAIAFVAALPLLACAFARSPASATLTIANNSDWTFHHLYLSPVDQDNWGPDQLNGALITPGSSYGLSLTCSSQIKVITEDQNGCFLYRVASCNDNATWTVTNNAAPDCGGGK